MRKQIWVYPLFLISHFYNIFWFDFLFCHPQCLDTNTRDYEYTFQSHFNDLSFTQNSLKETDLKVRFARCVEWFKFPPNMWNNISERLGGVGRSSQGSGRNVKSLKCVARNSSGCSLTYLIRYGKRVTCNVICSC